MFTRFVADRLFQRKRNVVVPNLLGVLTLTTFLSGAFQHGGRLCSSSTRACCSATGR